VVAIERIMKVVAGADAVGVGSKVSI